MGPKHLELPLASIFMDRAVPIENFTLPRDLHGSWFTTRNIQLLIAQDLVKEIARTHNMIELCKQIPNFSKSCDTKHLKNIAQEFINRSRIWRQINGVFPFSRLQNNQHGASLDLTMNVALGFTDDQWFFGVIFDIDMATWSMTPCNDKLAMEDYIDGLPLARPRYPLPVPQDVDETFRQALRSRGRDLPTFKLWVARTCHFIPAAVLHQLFANMNGDHSTPQQSRSESVSTLVAPNADDNSDDLPATAATTINEQESRKRPITAATQPSAKRQQTIIDLTSLDDLPHGLPAVTPQRMGVPTGATQRNTLSSVAAPRETLKDFARLDLLLQSKVPFSYSPPPN